MPDNEDQVPSEDENLQEEQNLDNEEVETQEEEQPEEQEEQSDPETEEESTEEPAEEAEEQPQEEREPSRRERRRIEDLLSKYGDPDKPRQTQETPERLDYNQALDADPEVIRQLEEDRKAEYTRGREESGNVVQQLQWSNFYNNIRFDYPVVAEKMSKLDPVDAQLLDREYMAITGADPEKQSVRNPNIGYAEFIEARIEQAERLAKSFSEQTRKNVTKQAAQTGLRPDGSAAKRLNLNQAPETMTDEELDAVIRSSMPRK